MRSHAPGERQLPAHGARDAERRGFGERNGSVSSGVSMRNVIAVVQARMASTRLPGKVLADIEGHPMLMRVVERTRRAKSISRVVVATTTEPPDDPVNAWCRTAGVDVFRGS